jgi:hypothetical protein
MHNWSVGSPCLKLPPPPHTFLGKRFITYKKRLIYASLRMLWISKFYNFEFLFHGSFMHCLLMRIWVLFCTLAPRFAAFVSLISCWKRFIVVLYPYLFLKPGTHSMPRADLASSARRGAGFPWVVHEGPLLPTVFRGLQRYYPNITIIWDGRICMFTVLLVLHFVY